MLPLSVETQVLTALAYDPLSYNRIFLLQKILKFGNKIVTLDRCFVSNQQRIVALLLTSENNAKIAIFWVAYNPAHVHELKYQKNFRDNIKLNLLNAPYTVFVY